MLPLLRGGGVPTWDTIWLEDSLYVEQANEAGPIAVLFRGYAGYLQLVSRLLAVPTAVIPSSWVAAYLAVSAATLCALGAAFVYRQTDGLVRSVEVRLVIAAMVVLSPAMAVETTATIINIIWTVLAVAPFAFVSVRESRRDIVMRSAVGFLAATATALSALFLPLAIGYAIARRSRANIIVACSYGAGLVLQLLVVRVSPVGERSANSVRILVDMFGLRVLGSFLMGERPLDQLWTQYGEVVVVVLVLLVAAMFAYLIRGAGRRNQILAAILLAYAGAAFVLPAWGRGTSVIGFDLGVYSLNMTRYTVGPILLLVTAAAVLVDPALERRARPLPFDGRKVLLVQTLLVLAVGFVYPTVRGNGPGWRSESARVFAEECRGVPSDTVVHITTTPQNFSVALTCERLAS